MKTRQQYNLWVKHWRARRKACIEIVDAISEMAEQKRSVFMETAGLEDDIEYGVDLNTFPQNAAI